MRGSTSSTRSRSAPRRWTRAGSRRSSGSELTFWGGAPRRRKVLPFGTPEEVYANTTELISIFKPGGGFVFNQVHNIQAQVPPQNIEAMYQAVHDNWSY